MRIAGEVLFGLAFKLESNQHGARGRRHVGSRHWKCWIVGRRTDRGPEPQGHLCRHHRQCDGVVRLRRIRLSCLVARREFLSEGRPEIGAVVHLRDIRGRPGGPSARRHRHRPHGRHAWPKARADPDHSADGDRHRAHRLHPDLWPHRHPRSHPPPRLPDAARLLDGRRMGRLDGLHGRMVGRGEARLLHEPAADVGRRRHFAGLGPRGDPDLDARRRGDGRLGLAHPLPSRGAVPADRPMASPRGRRDASLSRGRAENMATRARRRRAAT